jgi:hypothetical protein
MGRSHVNGFSRGVLVLPVSSGTGAVQRAAPPENDLRASGGRVRTGYSRLLKRMMEHVWNLGTLVWLPPLWGMIKTADDRRTKGRSLRSSLSAGKPHTCPNNGRRRKAVDTVSQQEVGLCPAW